DRRGPVLEQRMLVLDARFDQPVAADEVVVDVARPERLVVVSADAVVAAGEEAHGQRYPAEQAVLEDGADTAAQQNSRLPRRGRDPLPLRVELQQRDVRAEAGGQYYADPMAFPRP